MKFHLPILTATCLWLIVAPAAFAGEMLARDSAASSAYDDGWSDENSGYGFGDWALRDDGVDSGVFMGNSDYIETDGRSHAFFGHSGQSSVAYRAFEPVIGPPQMPVGATFYLKMENGNINGDGQAGGGSDGSVGFTLRNGNATTNPGNYDTDQRFQFLFIGGDTNYSYLDGDDPSLQDSGIPFTANGLEFEFTLQTANTYEMRVKAADTQSLLATLSGSLISTMNEEINSMALFHRNTGSPSSHNSFFNSFRMAIETPEPSSGLMVCGLLMAACLRRRRR